MGRLRTPRQIPQRSTQHEEKPTGSPKGKRDDTKANSGIPGITDLLKLVNVAEILKFGTH